jgi:hypothetical protein
MKKHFSKYYILKASKKGVYIIDTTKKDVPENPKPRNLAEEDFMPQFSAS